MVRARPHHPSTWLTLLLLAADPCWFSSTAGPKPHFSPRFYEQESSLWGHVWVSLHASRLGYVEMIVECSINETFHHSFPKAFSAPFQLPDRFLPIVSRFKCTVMGRQNTVNQNAFLDHLRFLAGLRVWKRLRHRSQGLMVQTSQQTWLGCKYLASFLMSAPPPFSYSLYKTLCCS